MADVSKELDLIKKYTDSYYNIDVDGYDAQQCKTLLDEIGQNKNIKTLRFPRCALGESPEKFQVVAANIPSNIRKLDLKNNKLGILDIETLSTGFSKLSNSVICIDLGNNKISQYQKSKKFLGQLIASFPATVTELLIDEHSITDRSQFEEKYPFSAPVPMLVSKLEHTPVASPVSQPELTTDSKPASSLVSQPELTTDSKPASSPVSQLEPTTDSKIASSSIFQPQLTTDSKIEHQATPSKTNPQPDVKADYSFYLKCVCSIGFSLGAGMLLASFVLSSQLLLGASVVLLSFTTGSAVTLGLFSRNNSSKENAAPVIHHHPSQSLT